MIKKRLAIIFLSICLTFGFTQSRAFLPMLVAFGWVDAAGAWTATGMGALAVGAAAGAFNLGLIGERMGVIELGGGDAGDLDSIRLPTTDFPRDRPVANPDMPLSVPHVEPAMTIYVCPANHSDTTWCASYGTCTVSRAYTYVSSSASYCARTTTYGTPSVVPNEYGIVAGQSYVSNNIPKDYICNPVKYTGSPYGAGCQLKPDYVPICENGGTYSNGVCTITSEQREAIPDKNCDLKVSTSASGSTYITNNNDPDCAGRDIVTPDGHVRMRVSSNLDPENTGNPKPYDIVFDAGFYDFQGGYWGGPTLSNVPMELSGGSTFSITSQPSDKSKPAHVDKVDMVDGVVTSVSSQSVTGNIASVGTTYLDAAGVSHVVGANDVVLVVPTATGGIQAVPNTGIIGGSLSIPSDYARSGEAVIAADRVVNKLDEIPDDTSDLVKPDLTNPLIDYFNPLRSWTVPSQGGQCPSGSFDWNGQNYSFDAMCTLFENNLTLIQGSMTVFYVILALLIVLGA